MWGWLWDLLTFMGLFKKNAAIVLLGLDNAGKTTLLYKLKHGTIKSFIPTQRARFEEIDVGHVKFKAWDLGGHELVRSLWSEFYAGADGIVFLLDSADHDRLGEARTELQKLLADESIASVPIAVIANKTDLPQSLGRDRVVSALALEQAVAAASTQPETARPIEVFRCSLIMNAGHMEALEWLAKQL